MIYYKRTASFIKHLSVLTLLFNCLLINAQTYVSNNIELIPIEHASLVLKTNDLTIAIDPTMDHPSLNNTIDMILITDIHGDHFNKEAITKILSSSTTIIAPQAVYDKMSDQLKSQTSILNNSEIYKTSTVSIEAIPMYNLREEALNFHVNGRGNGYVLNLDQQRIYISGDTEDIKEMRALKEIDIALVCMNLPYTMTETSAASAVMEFKPKTIIPYHFRGSKVSDINLFESLITDSQIKVVRLDWYTDELY